MKTIGDEVMFVHDDVVAGCRTALELARRYRDDEALSDVRVGLALGPVLERDGDVFGHTVNLASRIVSVAYPGSVIVSAEVHDAVRELDDFAFNSLRSHYLKDIGRVPLWRMRSADDPLEGSFRSARRDYAVRQKVLEERWDEQRTAARQRAEGVVDKLDLDVDELPGRLSDAFRGTASPEDLQALIDSPTDGEIDALANAVLDADIDPEVQVDMLTDLGLAKAMAELRLEAERMAPEADGRPRRSCAASRRRRPSPSGPSRRSTASAWPRPSPAPPRRRAGRPGRRRAPAPRGRGDRAQGGAGGP